MLLKVSDLLLGQVRFAETFAPGAIDFLDPQFRQADPIVAEGFAEVATSTMEIRIRGKVETRLEYACDRCLEATLLAISFEFDLLYRPASLSPEHGEVALRDEEAEVGFYEGEGIDLVDVLREQVLLQAPMQRVCREDCKGICPVCGQNRNQVDCACQTEPADDRWAGLRNL